MNGVEHMNHCIGIPLCLVQLDMITIFCYTQLHPKPVTNPFDWSLGISEIYAKYVTLYYNVTV